MVLAVFQWSKEKETSVGELQGEGGKAIYLCPWGYICSPEEICHEIQPLEPNRVGGLPSVVKGGRKGMGRWVHSHCCAQVLLTLYREAKHLVRLSRGHSCRSSLRKGTGLPLICASCQQEVHLCFFSLQSLTAEIAWWFTEPGNTCLLHIWITSAKGLLLY